jgi:hypothetical protein
MKTALATGLMLITMISVSFLSGCKKKDNQNPQPETGQMALKFTHLVNGAPLRQDTFCYVNTAGNQYEIEQLMYFISDVKLHKSDGSVLLIDDWKDIHYVDVNIPVTLQWEIYDPIPVGSYDSISFTFGISAAKNQSFMFVNPPEVNMMWPDVLGGGYHYLMINGKWIDTANVTQPFNFHLGIGQLYKHNVIEVDSIYAFVQNYFPVKLPTSAFTVEKDKRRQVEIIMNIDSWFNTPHIYDHNYWGGAIMQNQPAMQMAKENGFDVFTTGLIQ